MAWTAAMVPHEVPVTDAQVVVALDFGSTFSGFAWASRLETSQKIHKFYDWPHLGAAGGKHYCKTRTCLWYKPGATPGSFELQDWGYTAELRHSAALQRQKKQRHFSNVESGASNEGEEVGSFVKLFKSLHTRNGPSLSQANIPDGLTKTRMITDYLQKIGELAIETVQKSLGRHITKADVQWCITVPGIWDESGKQTMKCCMEMAGLVRGHVCNAELASPFPLIVVLEPEAASVYCQQKVESDVKPGMKFLIVDIGGFTVDLLIHEKVDDLRPTSQGTSSPRAHALKMKEIAPGTGDYCGGAIVDERFIKFLRKKISCYEHLSKNYAESILKVMSQWESVKYSFDGTEEFPFDLELPARMAKAWEDHEKGEKEKCEELRTSESSYDAISISVADMKNIFEPSIKKILELIEKQLSQVKDLKIVMVVGGFSGSPYLKKRIKMALEKKPKQKEISVVFPDEPGSAVCCGAVVFGMHGLGMIATRFARKTYGISINRPFRIGDPINLLMEQSPAAQKRTPPRKRAKRLLRELYPAPSVSTSTKYCRNTLDIFTRKGDEVPYDYRVTRRYVALTDVHKKTKIKLYSSCSSSPSSYISSANGLLKAEGTFIIHHPNKETLGCRPSFLVSMHFGRTSIEVTAKGLNFEGGSSDRLFVTFEHI